MLLGLANIRAVAQQIGRQSGRDLRRWSQAWLETAGISTIKPQFSVDESGHYSEFELIQTAPTVT